MPNNALDLWTPIVPDDRQHNNFRGIVERGSQAGRDVISSWAEGFADRDGKFVQEFQTTFDSAFWELYLFACFRHLQLSPSADHHAPDFMLTIGSKDVAVEATVAKEADGHRSRVGQVRPHQIAGHCRLAPASAVHDRAAGESVCVEGP